MKTFETPVIEVKKFYVEEILTASSWLCGPYDENNNGCLKDTNGGCGGDECDNTEGPED